MMLHKNMKAMVSSADGDIDFLNVVSRILQVDALAAYNSIICQDYERQSIQ